MTQGEWVLESYGILHQALTKLEALGPIPDGKIRLATFSNFVESFRYWVANLDDVAFVLGNDGKPLSALLEAVRTVNVHQFNTNDGRLTLRQIRWFLTPWPYIHRGTCTGMTKQMKQCLMRARFGIAFCAKHATEEMLRFSDEWYHDASITAVNAILAGVNPQLAVTARYAEILKAHEPEPAA